MKLLQPFIILAGLLFGALPECLYCVRNRTIETIYKVYKSSINKLNLKYKKEIIMGIRAGYRELESLERDLEQATTEEEKRELEKAIRQTEIEIAEYEEGNNER